MQRSVKKERTGWRDLGLSERHRRWGWDCPATDLDFLEYDNGRAVALVEYKRETAPPAYPSNSSIRAMVDLANRASVPIFGVRYALDYSWYSVTPLNAVAKLKIGSGKMMNEHEYVTFLYLLRDRVVPPEILNDLTF